MKTPFLSAICVASLLAFSAQDLFAQQRPLGPPAGRLVGITAVWVATAEWISASFGATRLDRATAWRRKRSPGGDGPRGCGSCRGHRLESRDEQLRQGENHRRGIAKGRNGTPTRICARTTPRSRRSKKN